MGLRRRSHRLAVLLEGGFPILVGWLAGAALAITFAALIYPTLDPDPEVPPAPLFTTPTTIVAAVLAGLLIALFVTTWLVQRGADRAKPAEILRAG